MTERNGMEIDDRLVGREMRLTEILGEGEVDPLLRGILRSGAVQASIRDERGDLLWGRGEVAAAGDCTVTLPLHLEGEVVGALSVRGEMAREAEIRGLAELLLEALRTILANNLKRILTAELHNTVVSRSYEELLEANRRLSASERNYRDLAENLEKLVEERTRELEKAHSRLLQREKMASVGQLAAGVAHEINNPLGFISSNLRTMAKYTERFIAMLDFYRCAFNPPTAGGGLAEEARRRWRELKLDQVCSDVTDLIGQSLEGAERVRRIVSDLKAFSHVDEAGERPVDLNREIDKTINVLAHRVGEGCEIVTDYRPLPEFVCTPSLLCQVFLNLTLNALQARPRGLRLVIATRHEDGRIVVSFRDNGPGVPEEIRDRIFEPFYTTRDVGSGTGMGLTVSYDIITGYGGAIEVSSPPGGGALFVITLPERR